VLALDPSLLDFAKPKHKRLMEIDDNFDNFSFEEVNAEANDEYDRVWLGLEWHVVSLCLFVVVFVVRLL
jgi:hypothetical protein